MIGAHCAALLPPLVNDIPEYREYIEFISRDSYALPHCTKTTDLHDEAASEIVDKCSARNVAPAPRVNQEYDSLRNQTLLHAQGIHLNTKELIRHIQTVKVHI